MQNSKTPLSKIRSTAIAKANRLQRCHRHLDQLAPAFAEWNNGEIYVCKRTGTFRYRFGDLSKSVTSWDAIARECFRTPEAFAFAAMVLVEEQSAGPIAPVQREKSSRANIIALAGREAA